MIIGVDVDDVVADLVSEWLTRYNKDYNDSLRLDQINTWSIVELVKPECRARIYDYLSSETLYSSIRPITGAKKGVLALREAGHRVIFVTSCVRGMFDRKWQWLINHGFLQPSLHTIDFIAATDKALIKVDLMIDDRLETVKAFGEKGVLFSRPWNNGSLNWKDIVSRYTSCLILN